MVLCLNGYRFRSWIVSVNHCFLMNSKLRLSFRATFKLYAPFICDTTHCSIIRFRGASRLARPSQEGEKMTTVWASRHEDLVSHDGVSPHVCDPMVVPHGEAVLEWGNPAGSAGDTCRDAAA